MIGKRKKDQKNELCEGICSSSRVELVARTRRMRMRNGSRRFVKSKSGNPIRREPLCRADYAQVSTEIESGNAPSFLEEWTSCDED